MNLPVFYDSEFKRIEALPRVKPWTEAELEEAQTLLTQHLKTPKGTMRLNALQARALTTIYDTGRLVGLMGAGSGKTLLTATIPTLVKHKRVLIITPAGLKEKTFDDWHDLQKHWQMHPLYDHTDRIAGMPETTIRIISYESFQTTNYASYLEEYEPTLIMADEGHALSRTKAGRTKRLFRYLRTMRNNKTPVCFVPLSGTFFRKSIRDASSILAMAMGEYSPLPIDYNSLNSWAQAIDEGVRRDQRSEPGPLLRWSDNPQDPSDIDAIRRGVHRRISETAGIVASTEVSSQIPLILRQRSISVPRGVRDAMYELRTKNVLPTGELSAAGVTTWNHAREIGAGFSYRWDPPAPEPWREARSAWLRFVNEALRSPKLDTPLQVWNLVEQGKYGDVPEFKAWADIKDSFRPKTVPTWISDFLVKDAENWALETKGIVWVGHTAAYTEGGGEDAESDLGQCFTKIPFFGAGDEGIKSYKGPCAASIRAHGTGKNLVQWDKALIMTMPSSGKTLEQLLARLHRERQEADLVTFYFYAHSRELVQALLTAMADSRYVEALAGQKQRVLSAAILDAEGHRLDLESLLDDEDPMFMKNAVDKKQTD